jgi:glycine cleavage system aminomethyltransferase T
VLQRALDLSFPLRCKLEHASLSDATYSAISCVWGQQDDNSAPVEVDYSTNDPATGQTLSQIFSTTTGENLALAFIHPRKDDEDLRLWADAMCINQEDDFEKSWQVQLMGEI